MFDTMTMTKVVGGLCGSLLVFLLGGWVAESIYVGAGAGHGEGHTMAYVIEPEEGGDTAAEPEPEVDFAELMASASAADGEGVYRNCRSCHSIEPDQNGTGPSLYGVVGRPADAVAGFAYSGALEQVVDVWDVDHLNGFLENPQAYAPGTLMSFKGLNKPVDRANLIAYLDSIDN